MKQNYRQAKRQKELARKARQQEKQHKRVRPDGEVETVGDLPAGAEPGAEPGGEVSTDVTSVIPPVGGGAGVT